MEKQLKETIEKFSGEPVYLPDDQLNGYIESLANVVYTDGKLDFKQFKETIGNMVAVCPKGWRKGQAVFNMIDAVFGVAREVQFGCGFDCFYNDDAIDEFIEKSYQLYWNHITKGDFLKGGIS